MLAMLHCDTTWLGCLCTISSGRPRITWNSVGLILGVKCDGWSFQKSKTNVLFFAKTTTRRYNRGALDLDAKGLHKTHAHCTMCDLVDSVRHQALNQILQGICSDLLYAVSLTCNVSVCCWLQSMTIAEMHFVMAFT